MADIVFTESARALAAKLIEEMPEYDQPCRPIVVVTWSGGVRDNRRGEDGEVIWETTEQPGWKSVVASWVEAEGVTLADHAIKVDGLTVFVDPRARLANGTLVVSATEGELSVEHRAA